jgi:hypothetical protein
MRKFISRNLIVFLSFAMFSVNGVCQSAGAKESNEPGNAVLVDKLKIELHIAASDRSSKAFVVVFNGSEATVWFPIDPTPAYRPDEKLHLIKIWFGYFDEIHGMHKEHYMVPAMHPVHPGETFKFELTPPSIVGKILKKGMKPEIQVRVATKGFIHSRVRNNQPLDYYINNSIVVDSVNSRE